MAESEFMQYIKLLKPICEGLNATFAGKVEFILHDLSKPEASVVLVVGSVTKRQLGAPATNVLINALRRDGNQAADIIGYPSATKDGKILRSSTVFLRNPAGEIIGCFCVNVDISDACAFNQVLTQLITPLPINMGTECAEERGKNEIFAQGIGDVVEEIILYEIKRAGHTVATMTKAEKVEIVRCLDRKGVFDVKNTPELLASILGTSVFTIYNYIKEVRVPRRSEERSNET